MFKRVYGTQDILPEEVYFWQKIEEISRDIFSIYNYKEIRVPIIEEASLFNRSLGEFTEVVQKQMFLINHHNDIYALRPEATASIVRAYIEHNIDKTERLAKFYYFGPMFRAERPQRGRLRQFHHIGCEALGGSGPDIDIEIISLAIRLLNAYYINDYNININTLGCTKDKTKLSDLLRNLLHKQLDKLCEDCHKRFKQNVLRILDCKNESCQSIVKKLDLHNSYLCKECQLHFTQLRQGLDSLGISYEVCPYLVRGLDYYTRTIFEITHKKLGSQNALGAGGRYDNLVNELGGPYIPAIGFAFGVERLMSVIDKAKIKLDKKNIVYLIALGDKAKNRIVQILHDLRNKGIHSDTDYTNRSLKSAMRHAHDLGADYVLILGDDELLKDVITIKDMDSGKQEEIKQSELINYLTKRIHYNFQIGC